MAMTELMVKLPDELAQRAKSAGLLTDSAIQRLLEEAMRRETGRRLLQVAERLHAAGVEPMSEVKAARAERRAREASQTQGLDPKKS
jgi:post-segregation antitoxin (ccd killing protein)